MSQASRLAVRDERVRHLDNVLDHAPVGPGGRTVELWRSILADIRRRRRLLERGTALAPLAEEISAVIKDQVDSMTTQVLDELEALGTLIATLRDSVGRGDVPVGLTDLIQSVVTGLLERDPVSLRVDTFVHLDARGQYSVGSLRPQGFEFDSPIPVVFHVPKLMPANMMLSPVLAHEGGHLIWSEHDQNHIPSGFDAIVQPLFDKHSGSEVGDAERKARRRKWALQLTDWFVELYCDSIATRVCGPSFLFALYARTAADTDRYDDHPPAAMRVRLVRELLEELGWGSSYAFTHPECSENWTPWNIRHPASGTSSDRLDARKAFLVEASQELLSAARALVAERCDVLEPLSPDRFDRILELLNHSIPPVQDEPGAPAISIWQAVCAGWVSALRDDTDDLAGVIRAVGSARVNGVVLKTVELSRIVELWRSHERDA